MIVKRKKTTYVRSIPNYTNAKWTDKNSYSPDKYLELRSLECLVKVKHHKGLADNKTVGKALFFCRIPHKSWDQVATLYATRGLENGLASGFWKLSAPGQIVIDANDGSNTWTDDANGVHRYLIQMASNEEIATEINALMMHATE